MSSDSRALIQRLYQSGFLVAPEVLETLNNNTIEAILQQTPPTTIVVSSHPPHTTTITTADVVRFYHHRFEALQPLLAAKTSSVSLAHASSFAEATVIGMVRELAESGFILDDPTNHIVVASKDTVSPGDVVAVTGAVREGRLVASTVAYVDVPLTRVPVTLPHPILLSPTPLPGALTPRAAPPTRLHAPPLDILVHSPPQPLSPDDVKQALRKRAFPPIVPYGPDPLLLEPLPHIVWLLQPHDWTASYKGIVVVSTGPATTAQLAPDLTATLSKKE